VAFPEYERFFREQKISGHEYLPPQTKAVFHQAVLQKIISVEDLRRLGKKICFKATPYEEAGRKHFIESDVKALCLANHPKTSEAQAVKNCFKAIETLVEKTPAHADCSKEEFGKIIDSVAPDRVILKTTANGFPTAILFFSHQSIPRANLFLSTADELRKALYVVTEQQQNAQGRKATIITLVPAGSQGREWIAYLGQKRRSATKKMFWKKP